VSPNLPRGSGRPLDAAGISLPCPPQAVDGASPRRRGVPNALAHVWGGSEKKVEYENFAGPAYSATFSPTRAVENTAKTITLRQSFTTLRTSARPSAEEFTRRLRRGRALGPATGDGLFRIVYGSRAAEFTFRSLRIASILADARSGRRVEAAPPGRQMKGCS
jgi:hypothetical protein